MNVLSGFLALAMLFVLAATAVPQYAEAAAPTGFTSQTYEDSDGDGTIDQVVVVINGGEALTTCTVTDAEVATDWTYVGNDLGGSLASSGDTHSCDTGTATVTLKISGADGQETGHSTAPTIAYDNDDADNSIANGSGNLGNVGAASCADGAAPRIGSVNYEDFDDDGAIDALRLLFTETLDAASVLAANDLTVSDDGDFTDLDFTTDGTDLITSNISARLITFMTESSVLDTFDDSGTLEITSQNSFSLTDGTNTNTDLEAIDYALYGDSAAPRVRDFEYQDSDGDGDIDTIDITFTEEVTGAGSVLGANDLTFDDVGDFTGAAFGSDATDLITTDVTSVSVTLGTASTAIDTREDSGTIAISSQNAFALNDGNQTNSDLEAQDQATFTDGADPVVSAVSPADGASSVDESADIVMTFSEAMDTGITYDVGDEVSVSPDPGGWANGVWSASDTVLTFTHSTDFDCGDTVTVTSVEASFDSDNGETLITTGPETGDWTFSTDSCSSGSGGQVIIDDSDESFDPTITLTQPSSGEQIHADSFFDIHFEVGGSGISRVDLWYQQAGQDRVSIASNLLTGQSPQTWQVPADLAGFVDVIAIGKDSGGSEIASDTVDVEIIALDLAPTDPIDETPELTDEEILAGVWIDEFGRKIAPLSDVMIDLPEGGEEAVSHVIDGWFIRSFDHPGIYKIESNGTVRRPFWDSVTFMTWADSWNDDVIWVTNSTLQTITLGSPMLHKPGVTLIKIQSLANVYYIEENPDDQHTPLIRWVADEATAVQNFGAAWADFVFDVDVTTFNLFTEGLLINGPESIDTSVMRTRAQVAALVGS